MTGREIAHRRLRNQAISRTAFTAPGDAVKWLGAVQAQDFAGATWAVGLRLRDGDADAVERAFTDGALLRTHMLRPTWHFVAPEDIRWMLALTGPRVQQLNARMHRKLELDEVLLARCCDVVAQALSGGSQLTRAELKAALRRAGIVVEGQRLAYVVMFAELEGVICSGARRGKQFTYALLDERVPHSDVHPRDEALAELARRYFVSRGPATVHDFAKWSGLTIADARRGLDGARGWLQAEVADERTYWSSSEEPADGAAPSPSAFLLSVYDEYVSGYKDRTAIIDSGHAGMLTAMGNAPAYITVIDGRIVGSWRRRHKKRAIEIELDTFADLGGVEYQSVRRAAERYGAFFRSPVSLL